MARLVHTGQVVKTLPLADWPVLLPSLAEGETLYSWCGTFHTRVGSGNALATSRQLFGSNYSALLHDFPAHLGEFERRTGGALGSARELALWHTLLGYFVPFLDAQRGEGLITATTNGSVPDLKMRLGIPASGVAGYHSLRCCKECIERDKETIGWPIWHLVHQAPAVLVCPWHHRPLIQTWHHISPVHRRIWLTPDAGKSDDRYEIKLPNKDALRLLVELARLSEHVFRVEPGAWNRTMLGAVYRQRAMELGAITREGSLRHLALARALSPRFNHLEETFGMLVPRPVDLRLSPLLTSVIRSAPKPTHPLKHLALLIALFGEATTAIDAISHPRQRAEMPIITQAGWRGKGDAPARKAASQTEFLAAIKGGLSVRAAAESAGVSTSTGVRWARQSGIEFTRRAKVMTSTLLERIRADLGNGLDRSLVASTHRVSLVSINRLLSTEHDLLATWRRVRYDAARARNRARLLALIHREPTMTNQQLKKMPGSGWTWLYRHDRAWLEATLPTLWNRVAENP